MKAFALESFESGPRLMDLPVPVAGPNEVLVRVLGSSVNGFDVFVASGMAKGMMEHQFPVILGRDIAGVVEEVGPGVTGFKLGDEVFGFVSKPVLHDGAWAEYVVAPEVMSIGPKPKDLDFTLAGALPVVGTTALAGIEVLSPSQGDKVLIVGATGGVGSCAVQLAADRGAWVIATGLADDEAYLRGLGASEVVDYSGDVVGEVRSRHPEGIQGLLDVVHRGEEFLQLAELVSPGGRVASTLEAADPGAFDGRGIRAEKANGVPAPEVLARLAELADSGELKVPLQSVYRLEEAGKALEEFRGRTRGKVGITVGE